MKLYATTTSERASKGQGGQFLNIVIYDDQKQEIARFVATQEENGYVIAYDYDEDSTIVERWEELELATTKGNKQKGERHISYDEKVTGKSFIERMEDRNN